MALKLQEKNSKKEKMKRETAEKKEWRNKMGMGKEVCYSFLTGNEI